jgi:hypothetical protein
MSQVTFPKIKTLRRTLTSSAAVLLLGAGAATAGSLYEPQNAAQALLVRTVSVPAHASSTTGVHGIGRGDDGQESARRMIVRQPTASDATRRVVVASSSRLHTRDDANVFARRMILRGGT